MSVRRANFALPAPSHTLDPCKLNLWIIIPNCFWLLLLLLPPIYHCLWVDMLSNYLSAQSSTTSTVLDSVDTGARGCGIAEGYGHRVLLRETHHSHAHCTHTQQDLTDLPVMIARPVTSETITIGHLEPRHADASASPSLHTPCLILTLCLCCPSSPSGLSFFLQPQCRRLANMHLRWAMPQKRAPQYLSTHVTHVVHDTSLMTTHRRIHGCCKRIRPPFLCSFLFHPSPVARSILVYSTCLALAREEDHCIPAASSHTRYEPASCPIGAMSA